MKEEAEQVTKQLKKLWAKYGESKGELDGAWGEWAAEKEDMLDSVRMLQQQLTLKDLVIQAFVPPEDVQKVHQLPSSVHTACCTCDSLLMPLPSSKCPSPAQTVVKVLGLSLYVFAEGEQTLSCWRDGVQPTVSEQLCAALWQSYTQCHKHRIAATMSPTLANLHMCSRFPVDWRCSGSQLALSANVLPPPYKYTLLQKVKPEPIKAQWLLGLRLVLHR